MGKPVVFIHCGALGADMWEYQMPYLAGKGLRCVAYDKRGCGRSSQPWSGYDFDTFADDLAAVIEHLDLWKVTLVGHSMGLRRHRAIFVAPRCGAYRSSRARRPDNAVHPKDCG